MRDHSAMVVLFPGELHATRFVERLHHDGVSLKQVSLAGRDGHVDDDDHWERLGLHWGRLWGCLFGAFFLGVPGIGPIVVAGPLARELIRLLQGNGDNVQDALSRALGSLGVPVDSMSRYELALREDGFLVVLTAPPEDEAAARSLREHIDHLGGVAYVEEPLPV